MNPLHAFLKAFRGKRELQEELQSHLNLAVADRVARGEFPAAARREALREFGNMPLIADVTRERWGWLRLEHLLQDLRFAIHQLSRSPGFAITAVLTLALGIGANVAIFSLIYAFMLRSLPIPHPEQLVQLKMRTSGATESDAQITSMYNAVAARQQSLSGMCGVLGDSLLLTSEGDPRRVETANVTGDCFTTLQVAPVLGRLLLPSDDIEGGGSGGYAAVLSYDYWDAHFHRDPRAIGRKLLFENVVSETKACLIVGVLPKGFGGLSAGSSPLIFLPSYFEGRLNRNSNGNVSMSVFGRLKPGVSRAQAELQLRPAFAAWREAIPEQDRGADLKTDLSRNELRVYGARTGGSDVRNYYRKPLWFLQSLVGLILLAGCAYLSTLLSARTLGRRQELALRIALGASRSRIVFQLMVESLLLAAIGSSVGLLLALAVGPFLVNYLTPSSDPIQFHLRIDSAMLAFAVGIAGLSALLTGLAPAIRGSNANLIADIKIGKGGAFGGKRCGRRLGAVLLPLQIAFSVVFVVLAGLLSASLVRVLGQNSGFRLNGTVFAQTTIRAVMTAMGDKDEGKLNAQLAVYRSLLEQLNVAPGVVSASLAQLRPLGGAAYGSVYKPVGEKSEGSNQVIYENWVAPHYFDTVGTHLQRGREFSKADTHDGQKVCILSAAAAQLYFPQQDAIGRTLKGLIDPGQFTVVGIVEDTRWITLQSEMPRMIYFPIDQQTRFLPSMQIVLRADDTASALVSLRRVLREQAGAQVLDVVTMRDAVDQSLGVPRLLATLSNSLAGLALLLSAVAIYGLLSYSVKQRTAEIAVRMAVGASRADVVRMVARQAAWLVLPGLAAGAIAAAALSKVIKSLLYQTSPIDPIAFSISLGVLLAVATVAALDPARKAASIEPMEALRAE